MNAKQITENINWLLEDASLKGYKVRTSRKCDLFETTIRDTDPMRTRSALQEYLTNTAGSDIADREARGDRFVVVTQPAN